MATKSTSTKRPFRALFSNCCVPRRRGHTPREPPDLMKKLLSVAACGLSKLVPVPRQSKYAPAFTLTACAVLGVIVMLAIPVAAAQPTTAAQLAVDFDTETLKERGLEPTRSEERRVGKECVGTDRS